MQEIKNVSFDHYELANLVSNILEMSEGKIEDQKVLRDIIDHQFILTRKTYYLQFWFFTIFYCIPFWYQIKEKDYWLVLWCN